jgi:hypothetical protein
MSSFDKTTKQGTHLDFQDVTKIYNLPTATQDGQPVILEQLNQLDSEKQDNMTGGSGIELNGNDIKVDLAVTGSDYGSLTLSNTNHASLDGTYTRAAIQGTLSYVGTDLDLDVGGTFNIYYKSNGGGVWAVVIKRDTDNIYGNNSTGESTGNWLAVLTTIDPTSITEDYNSFIPNYQAVDSDFITVSSEQDENGNASPSSADSNVDYAGGSTPAGLKFENNKLAVDFASSVNNASSTKVFPSSVVKTYVDEQVAESKVSANNSFSNQQAGLTGNPSNVQSAIESAKTEINGVASDVSTNQATAATEYAKISSIRTVLGTITNNLGSFTNSNLPDDSTLKPVLEALADALDNLRSDTSDSLGMVAGSTFSTATGNVRENADLVEAVEDLDVAVSLIQGDLTSRLPSVDYFHDAVTYPLASDQLNGIAPFNNAKYDLQDDTGAIVNTVDTDMSALTNVRTILISYGDTGTTDAGVYARALDGTLSRVSWLDEPVEIQKNAVTQVMRGGVIAGTDFVVATSDEPTIGVDPIGFKVSRANVIGKEAVVEWHLHPDLRAKLQLRHDETFDLTTPDGSGGFTKTITHNLYSEDVIVHVKDANGEFIHNALEVSVIDAYSIKINSLFSQSGLRVNVRD